MIRIAVCDQCRLVREELTYVLENWAVLRDLNVKIVSCESSEALLIEIELYGHLDLVFMEVQLEKNVNGIGIAAQIKKIHPLIEIVFISEREDYYKAAIAIHPFACTDKPLNRAEIIHILDEAFVEAKVGRDCFRFQYKKVIYSIRLNEICYIEQRKRMVQLHCLDEKCYQTYIKMQDAEIQIGLASTLFLRVHHGFLVNAKYIKEMHYNKLILQSGEVIPISYHYQKVVREKYKSIKL